MIKEYDPIRTTQSDSRVFVDAHYEDEVWLSINTRNGSSHVTLTKAQAQQMIERLTEIVSNLADGE
jgi:type III secretory pathway component EscV